MKNIHIHAKPDEHVVVHRAHHYNSGSGDTDVWQYGLLGAGAIAAIILLCMFWEYVVGFLILAAIFSYSGAKK